MYIYPDNMKSGATLFLWRLPELVAIIIGAILSMVSIVAIGFIFPAAAVGAFAFLTIRFDDMSIFDYVIQAFKFCVSKQQTFFWRWDES